MIHGNYLTFFKCPVSMGRIQISRIALLQKWLRSTISKTTRLANSRKFTRPKIGTEQCLGFHVHFMEISTLETIQIDKQCFIRSLTCRATPSEGPFLSLNSRIKERPGLIKYIGQITWLVLIDLIIIIKCMMISFHPR